LALYLKVEQNKTVASAVMNKLKESAGLTMLVPYLSIRKNVFNAGSQNLSFRLNRLEGVTLVKAIHIPNNETESKETTYDNSNVDADKVSSLYTSLDNNRLQDFNITCETDNLDWMIMQSKLKGSVYLSRDMYRYNWFYEDSWNYVCGLNDEKNVDDQNLNTGLLLKDEVKYDVTIPSSDTPALIWYSCFVTNRELKITTSSATIK
jgi:hypothetical protein